MIRKAQYLFCLCLMLFLAGCVTPPPIESTGDALGQSVAAIDAAALSVRSAELSKQITAEQAVIAKAKLQQAYNVADAARAPGANPNESIQTIQNLLNAVIAMLPEEK